MPPAQRPPRLRRSPRVLLANIRSRRLRNLPPINYRPRPRRPARAAAAPVAPQILPPAPPRLRPQRAPRLRRSPRILEANIRSRRLRHLPPIQYRPRHHRRARAAAVAGAPQLQPPPPARLIRPVMDLSKSIAYGFDDKVAEIIEIATASAPKLFFDDFTDILMDKDFISDIFKDKTSMLEIQEMSQAVINITKLFVIQETNTYEQSCAALFLLYCLMMKQPIPDYAPVFLKPEDVPAIREIETIARDTRRLEVIYILGEILIRGPVVFFEDSRKLLLGFLDDTMEIHPPAASARG